MGFFDHIQKKGSTAIKAQPAQVRREIIIAPANPTKVRNLASRLRDNRILRVTSDVKRQPVNIQKPAKPRARNLRKRPSSAQLRLESDSDESSTDGFLEDSRKRVRISTDAEVDKQRQVRCRMAFSEDGGSFPIVRASDIASLRRPAKYRMAFPEFPQATEILLQYPSASQREE